ncbi:YadA-like family protein [Salmonella enterica]|uniref:YadA-like family protein n=1 Tax=Salmonella enterica TaxID=28901 RepID=UPI003D31A272
MFNYLGNTHSDSWQGKNKLPILVLTALIITPVQVWANYAAGDSAVASGDSSTAVGSDASAKGAGSTALGDSSDAAGYYGTALGGHAYATEDSSTAIGGFSDAKGNGSTAVGDSSEATKNYGTALGESSKVTAENSVALGSDSVASRADEVNIGGKNNTGRYLGGVKEGVNDDDAVNLKQMNSAKKNAVLMANKYSDESLKSANQHTDTEIGKLDIKAQGYVSTAKTEAIEAANKNTTTEAGKLDTKAQGYASTAKTEAINTANKYTDRATLQANEKVLDKANSYTDDAAKQTLEGANTYTNHRAVQAENNAVARSNDYTNHRFSMLKQQVDRNEKRANGGIAGAMAMSAIPAGSGFGMAASGYRDQGAIAVGVQKKINPDTSVSLKAAWDSGNGAGIATGFLIDW